MSFTRRSSFKGYNLLFGSPGSKPYSNLYLGKKPSEQSIISDRMGEFGIFRFIGEAMMSHWLRLKDDTDGTIGAYDLDTFMTSSYYSNIAKAYSSSSFKCGNVIFNFGTRYVYASQYSEPQNAASLLLNTTSGNNSSSINNYPIVIMGQKYNSYNLATYNNAECVCSNTETGGTGVYGAFTWSTGTNNAADMGYSYLVIGYKS